MKKKGFVYNVFFIGTSSTSAKEEEWVVTEEEEEECFCNIRRWVVHINKTKKQQHIIGTLL